MGRPDSSAGICEVLWKCWVPTVLLSHRQRCKQPRWKLEQSRSCSRLRWASPETRGYLTASHQQGAALAPAFFHAHILLHLTLGPGLSWKFSLSLTVSNHFSKLCEDHTFLADRIGVNQCKIFFFFPHKWKLFCLNLILLCSSRVSAFSPSWRFNSGCSSSAFPKIFSRICHTWN